MKKISIEIDDRLYQVLLNSSVESMRSFRKQIVFDLIETYKDELAKLPTYVQSVIDTEKPKKTAAVITKKPDECHCKDCGVYVHMRPEQFKNNGELCQDCKKKEFDN